MNRRLFISQTITSFFNNYHINQDTINVNTNAIISRGECERNVCENELNRLRSGLENLLRNNVYDNLEISKKNRNDDENEFRDSFISASSPLYTKRMKYDSTYKSLLYKILEAKLFECLSTNQKLDKTPSDSIRKISSLESSSISAFPSETPTLNLTLPKRIPKSNTLEVNDYEKSTLAVPKPSTSRSKKSKKRKHT